MKKLLVRFMTDKSNGFDAGKLIWADSKLFFEYEPHFLQSGIELSPFFLPLKEGVFEHNDRAFGHLWGLFDDSLPDGWGMLLLDRHFKKKGASFSSLSPIDKLAYLGSKTMGTLCYYPPFEEEENYEAVLDLQKLSDNANHILSGDEKDVLPVLLRAGGSPGGARPKIVAGFNPETKEIISGESVLLAGFEHWLIKFSSTMDIENSSKVEFAYSLMALDAGINVPQTRLFDGDNPKSFFGIKRFDRGENNKRFHIHTFGNLIHSNFRIPSADYNDLMKTTMLLTKNIEAVEEMFKRMVFNVFTNNRDDHVKNFSYIYDINNLKWDVAPAYDLTFSEGPGGEHSMTVNGSGKNINLDDILAVAKKTAIKKSVAIEIIEKVRHSLGTWKNFAKTAEIPSKTASELAGIFKRNSQIDT